MPSKNRFDRIHLINFLKTTRDARKIITTTVLLKVRTDESPTFTGPNSRSAGWDIVCSICSPSIFVPSGAFIVIFFVVLRHEW